MFSSASQNYKMRTEKCLLILAASHSLRTLTMEFQRSDEGEIRIEGGKIGGEKYGP